MDVRFDEGKLREKAGQLSGLRDRIKTANDTIVTNYSKLGVNWEGESYDAFSKKYLEFDKVKVELEKLMDELVAELEIVAGIYEQAGKEAKEVSNALPIDAVFLK
ncbi:MAG: WXG100 family type VII secretion target [Erysipelotrichaceae bacterium]|nr:WXG100 family type VII secretion target [Erysipelotrichaceae bacterium]